MFSGGIKKTSGMKWANDLNIIIYIGFLPVPCIRVGSIVYLLVVRKHFPCEFKFELKSNSGKISFKSPFTTRLGEKVE